MLPPRCFASTTAPLMRSQFLPMGALRPPAKMDELRCSVPASKSRNHSTASVAGYNGRKALGEIRNHAGARHVSKNALTLMRTSCGPGADTFVSTNSRTSGPPAFANLMVRDMGISWIE